MTPTRDGWDTWAKYILHELERLSGTIEALRDDIVTLQLEFAATKEVLKASQTVTAVALEKAQKNEVKLRELTVKSGLIAIATSTIGTGLGVLFIYLIGLLH